MEERIVKSQAELDAIPVDFNGRIIIQFGTPFNRAVVNRKFDRASVEAWWNSSVEAWWNSSVVARENSSVVARENSSVVALENSSVVALENSSVVARENSSVVAWENSSVVAWENSSVVAWGNSSVVAWENSSVEAWWNSSVVALENSSVVALENSSVVAWENSYVVARENSSVVAWENSSVEAWGNSSVVARGSAQVTDRQTGGRIKRNGNARVVCDPRNIDEYIDHHNLEHDGTTVNLFKAVRKIDGRYFADYDKAFEYIIGEQATASGLDDDVDEACGRGIHLAHKAWCVDHGRGWKNLAILEFVVEKSGVVVPRNGVGKVRSLNATPIKEVPLKECGLYGKILDKRLRKTEGANG